jgi:LysM repeat protein
MAFEKAEIINTDTNESISVLFNPEEYSLNQDNNFSSTPIPGMRAPILQFVHGNMRTLEMTLLFDTYEKHVEGSKTINEEGDDVRKLTNKVTDLLKINPATHAPPILLFTWGNWSFTCVLARANQQFIMFRADGIPLRARLTVTFNEYVDADTLARDPRHTADFTKLHVVQQGETLSRIAMKHYENPQLWRPIAIANNIDDPRPLATGLKLQIPALPFIDPESGEVIE